MIRVVVEVVVVVVGGGYQKRTLHRTQKEEVELQIVKMMCTEKIIVREF